jgi:type II secretory pathway pseudopilin PulG
MIVKLKGVREGKAMPFRHRRLGFALTDLIVVLAILGVVAILAVAGIAKVRGTATQTRCLNNMRQIALACHNCNDALGSMPPFQAGDGRGLPKDNIFAKPGNKGSVLYFVLPFVESNCFYYCGSIPKANGTVYSVNATYASSPPPWTASDQFKYEKMPFQPTGVATDPPTPPFVGQFSIMPYHCPADPTMSPSGVQPVANWGACSYACNYLVFGNPKATKDSAPSIDNPDGYDPKATPPHVAPAALSRLPGSFPDGVAYTLLFAEKYSVCNWFQAGSTTMAQPGGNLWAWPGDNASYAPAFAMESPWNQGPAFQVRPDTDDCNAAFPSTGHDGSMSVAMADCSCRTISPAISHGTWVALCTPNAGDQVGEDF